MAGSTRLRMLAAVLSVLMASASGFEVAVDPSSPKVGDDVHFYVTGINEDLRFSEWYQGAGIPAENQIIRYNTGTGTTNRGAKFREEFEIFPNGSLLIKNVKKEMAGLYTVNIQGRSQAFQKTVNLTVVDGTMEKFEVHIFPPNPQASQDVFFNVTGITEDLRFSEWYRGDGIHAENQIIRYNTGSGDINQGAKFTEEFVIYPNGSLLIRSFKKEMAGLYTVNIQGRTHTYQKTVNLTVVDPGLGAGAIAGIVVGALAVVVAAIAIGVYFFQKSKKDSGPL